MDVSTPPSLDLACPQAEADIKKYVHMFRDRGVDKIKYEHEGIMITLITATHTQTYFIHNVKHGSKTSLRTNKL